MTIMDTLKAKIQSLRGYEEKFDKKYKDMDDTVTRDRYLRSLRREKRMIDEKYEKEHLKKVIKNERQKETREYVWGVKSNQFKAKPKPEFKLCDTSKGLCGKSKKIQNIKGKWL